MSAKRDLPIKPFESKGDWSRWLDARHADTDGVWLKFAKKSSGIKSVTYAEAVDVALCYGWIDGQARSCDDQFYLQRFTPRTARSKWSKINRDKATACIEQGRMQPAGLSEVERAKHDGRWDAAYDSPSTMAVPSDFQQQLDQNADAKEFFATLNKTNWYSILYQIQDAKKPETRARRIEKFIAMLNEGKKLH